MGAEVHAVEALAVVGPIEGGPDRAGAEVQGVGETEEYEVVVAGVGHPKRSDLGRKRALARGRLGNWLGGPRAGLSGAASLLQRRAVGGLAGLEGAAIQAAAVVLGAEVFLDHARRRAEELGQLDAQLGLVAGVGIAQFTELFGHFEAIAGLVGIRGPQPTEGVGELGAAVDTLQPLVEVLAIDAEESGEIVEAIAQLAGGARVELGEVLGHGAEVDHSPAPIGKALMSDSG